MYNAHTSASIQFEPTYQSNQTNHSTSNSQLIDSKFMTYNSSYLVKTFPENSKKCFSSRTITNKTPELPSDTLFIQNEQQHQRQQYEMGSDLHNFYDINHTSPLDYDENNEFDNGRKTKSKEAARMRRNKENDEFKVLSSLLPLKAEITQQLDKASIIRLTISYFKIRKLFEDCKISHLCPSKVYRNFVMEKCETNQSFNACLDGFLFLLSNDSRFLYVSESISATLGLSQVVLIGTSIFEYIHDDDKREFAQQLGIKSYLDFQYSETNQDTKLISNDSNTDTIKSLPMNLSNSNRQINLTIRFKSVLLKRTFPHKYSGWRILQIIGRIKAKGDKNEALGFFGIASGVETQLPSELSLKNNIFTMTLNSKCIIESLERSTKIYHNINLEEFKGKSFFHIVHPQDLEQVRNEFKKLKLKNQNCFSYRIFYTDVHNPGSEVYAFCNCTIILINSAKSYLETAANMAIMTNLPDDSKILTINEIFLTEANSMRYSHRLYSKVHHHTVNLENQVASTPSNQESKRKLNAGLEFKNLNHQNNIYLNTECNKIKHIKKQRKDVTSKTVKIINKSKKINNFPKKLKLYNQTSEIPNNSTFDKIKLKPQLHNLEMHFDVDNDNNNNKINNKIYHLSKSITNKNNEFIYQNLVNHEIIDNNQKNVVHQYSLQHTGINSNISNYNNQITHKNVKNDFVNVTDVYDKMYYTERYLAYTNPSTSLRISNNTQNNDYAREQNDFNVNHGHFSNF